MLLLYQVVMAWGLGYFLVEMRAMVVDPEDTDSAVRLGLHLLPTREYPRLRALLPAMADLDADAEFAAGLDALLERFAP
ncbi:hypothetical protein ABT063_24480 [Streptomyces sp. NPDC002838]|uniref:hypothetical protein n=1 Tax=Streptomyces sp. NPDC002838 TaxID=3154436 RepID=UPI0033192771